VVTFILEYKNAGKNVLKSYVLDGRQELYHCRYLQVWKARINIGMFRFENLIALLKTDIP